MNPIQQLSAYFGILITAFVMASCVHMKPADREFKANAFYEPMSYDGSEEEAEAALANLPQDPQFKQLEFDRSLDPALLRKPSGPYRVGPGDILDIEVAENAGTRQQVKILPDGMLHYDVANGIQVKGLTLADISTRLSKVLEEDYVNPVVSVNVAQADSQRFWMLGQIKVPGAYPIKKPTTLVDALSFGGGLLSNGGDTEVGNPEAADLERAILIRNGDLVPIDFEALIREGDMSQNVYVRSGDYIFVPSLTAQSIYVLGEVAQPGPVYYEAGNTLLSAVATAGGINKNAVGSKALIIRGGTRKPEVAVVNVNAIRRGNEPDLRLEGGDIVWIPRTPWTKLNDYVEAVLITAGQAVAVQEGLGAVGSFGNAGVTISAGGSGN